MFGMLEMFLSGLTIHEINLIITPYGALIKWSKFTSE